MFFFLMCLLPTCAKAHFSLKVNWCFNHYLHHVRPDEIVHSLNSPSSWLDLSWMQVKQVKPILLIWCQFISALWAIKEAKPCCSDKILLQWILQYWTSPDYYTENIEPVIRGEWSWNGEVHSHIILSWPLAYPQHTHRAMHESQSLKTHTHTHTLAQKHEEHRQIYEQIPKSNIQLQHWTGKVRKQFQ